MIRYIRSGLVAAAIVLSTLTFMTAELHPWGLSLRAVGFHFNLYGILVEHPSQMLVVDRHISIFDRLGAVFSRPHIFGSASYWTVVIPWWVILLVDGLTIGALWWLTRRISSRRGFAVEQWAAPDTSTEPNAP